MRCAPQDSRASLGWVPLRRPAPRFARATNTCALSGLTPIVLSWSRPTVMIAATCGGRLRHRKREFPRSACPSILAQSISARTRSMCRSGLLPEISMCCLKTM
ncbi:hypothetical protein PF004_g18250 [Phytophthora fragariae]|nr:hypothetical protein PF011_g18305 [Phytophthora fragariae]KAE9203004.1 hypothetical protein PF004_g18250 [Phytophthora fragariae]